MSLSNDCLLKTIGLSEAYEFLAVYPHNTAPGHNLHFNINSDLNNRDAIYNASVLFKTFPFTPSYPVPVYPPTKISRSELNRLDPCLALIKEKKAWEFYKDVLLNSCDKSMVADFNSDEESTEMTKVNVHPNLVLLATHMKKDPDRHFNASYNWYYSGSNIDIINSGDKKYLLRPNGSTGELLFSPLTLHNNEWISDTPECDELMINLKNSHPPCQVDVVDTFALIREKTNCNYLMLKESSNDKMMVEQLFDITSSNYNPFISASINKEDINAFCTLSPNEELTVWNVSLRTAETKLNLNLKESYSADSWGYVCYIGRNTILYADRQTVHIFDLRANNNIKDCVKWPINKLVDVCEEISCCSSGSNNVNYVGTNHHLLSLDMRQGWTQRWTHGITSSPSIIKTLQRNFHDYVFLASQRSDNVVFIQNDFKENSSSISRIHPYTLPSLRESLHVARYNGLCLDHLLTSRFTMSLTGLCCLEDRYINVIRCTSVGDIFWQKLESSNSNNRTQVSPKLSQDDIKKFEEFELKCEQDYMLTESKCRVTSVKQTKNLINYLYTSSPKDEEKESSMFEQKLPQCKQLKNYCDYLAPMLLEAWDIDVLAEGSIEGDTVSQANSPGGGSSSDEEYDIESAVSNWLNTYSKEMTTNTEYPADDDDLNLQKDDTDDVPINEESVEERLLPTTQTEILNGSTELVLNNTSKLLLSDTTKSPLPEKNIVVKQDFITPKRVTPQKPVPTSKKKYVAGF